MCARVKPEWDRAGNVGDIHSGAYGDHAVAWQAGAHCPLRNVQGPRSFVLPEVTAAVERCRHDMCWRNSPLDQQAGLLRTWQLGGWRHRRRATRIVNNDIQPL
jgi:hypothetical protein